MIWVIMRETIYFCKVLCDGLPACNLIKQRKEFRHWNFEFRAWYEVILEKHFSKKYWLLICQLKMQVKIIKVLMKILSWWCIMHPRIIHTLVYYGFFSINIWMQPMHWRHSWMSWIWILTRKWTNLNYHSKQNYKCLSLTTEVVKQDVKLIESY